MVSSHRRILPKSRSCAADSASTIVSELVSSTNEDTDVYGMSKISAGMGRRLPGVPGTARTW